MTESELAFFTTQELIAELMRRQTFCGVVVQAADENRSVEWPDERIFKLHICQSLDAGAAGRLLGAISAYIDVAPA